MSFDHVWLKRLHDTLINGDEVRPRGKLTWERPQATVEVDMRRPVLTIPERKLSYKFMAAEAHWILSGDNRVETIAPHNPRIAEFSDDGETFFGAYGPKIVSQLDYVVNKLLKDRDSRQAGLTIWRECPPETKDVPCTVAIFFQIRNAKVNCHVFMRSSDIWLGLPYDVFNFSMLAHLVCCRLNKAMVEHLNAVEPGTLYLTAASSHLYETNKDDAVFILDKAGSGFVDIKNQVHTPSPLYIIEDALMNHLDKLKEAPPGSALRWWGNNYASNPR